MVGDELMDAALGSSTPPARPCMAQPAGRASTKSAPNSTAELTANPASTVAYAEGRLACLRTVLGLRRGRFPNHGRVVHIAPRGAVEAR